MMRRIAMAAAPVMLLLACSGPGQAELEDDRFVVFGPSLVELMFSAGLGNRVIGVDRYSEWPEEAMLLPDVGGYVDPSLEQIASLSPTSIHVSGDNALLEEYSANLDIPCYSYDFDDLQGVYRALDSLDSRYGAEASMFKETLVESLDSLRTLLENVAPKKVLVVIYHERGASGMTVAGHGTFFSDILTAVGCEAAAPEGAAWPMVSAEGVLELAPDHVICLFPGREDTAAVESGEVEFFTGLGFQRGSIHCLFSPYMMIPGGRLPQIARDICRCLL